MSGSSSSRSSGQGVDTVRLFAAVELPDVIRSQLAGLQKDFPGIRWAASENMHLTLRFIGETGRKEADKARNALREVRVAPFFLCLRGLGLFERRRQVVLWGGLESSASLLELKRQADAALAEGIGLRTDQGHFSPHITLSRIRTGVSTVLREQAAGHSFASKSFAVESFTLFSSVLSPAGASHAALERYLLR